MSQASAPYPPVPPPTAEELPYDDGEPMESNRHRLQMTLCIEALDLHLRARGRHDFFVGGNLFLYYSVLQAKQNDFRGPDVLVALDCERRDRKSWVIWEEGGRGPDVVIELTSPSTAAQDRGEKKRIYSAVVGVPEYYIFDPDSGAFEGYRLDAAQRSYESLSPLPTGRLPSARLGLELGTWQGDYGGYGGLWLRWFTPAGQLIPTEAEARAEAERRADDAQAELARYRERFGPLP